MKIKIINISCHRSLLPVGGKRKGLDPVLHTGTRPADGFQQYSSSCNLQSGRVVLSPHTPTPSSVPHQHSHQLIIFPRRTLTKFYPKLII